jgi:hypothetical protein
MVFILILQFLEIFMSNDPNFKFNLRTLTEILDSLVTRSGRSACKWRTVPPWLNVWSEALQKQVQPKLCEADGPPKDRGQSVPTESVWDHTAGPYLLPLDFTPPYPTTSPFQLSLSLKHVEEDHNWGRTLASRTVRTHPRTLRELLHHVPSVFHWIPFSCS